MVSSELLADHRNVLGCERNILNQRSHLVGRDVTEYQNATTSAAAAEDNVTGRWQQSGLLFGSWWEPASASCASFSRESRLPSPVVFSRHAVPACHYSHSFQLCLEGIVVDA